jgi:hypothetical protein
MDGITKADIEKFPAITALRHKVAALPKIKAMYADAGERYASYR